MARLALRQRIQERLLAEPALIAWTAGWLVIDAGAALQGRSPPGGMFLASLPLLLAGIGCSALFHRLERRPWPRMLHWVLLPAGFLLAAVLLAAANIFYLRWLAETLVPAWEVWTSRLGLHQGALIAVLHLFVLIACHAVAWALDRAEAARVAEARARAMERAAEEARAAALRLQLNPHFLFNTLNGITALVVTRRNDDAERMIGELADFLRASLTSEPTARVTLAAELRTVQAYLGIEQARLGERLAVETRADPGAALALVPNFILQPLVENAVKHGVPDRGRALIRIDAALTGRRLRVIIENIADAPLREASRVHGIGLANTRQRLALAYGPAATLSVRPAPLGFVAELDLPFMAEALAA